MKKFFLLLLISISLIACSNPSGTISKEQYIEDLNSFDSTATYYATSITSQKVTFIISYKDSLFIYNVDRCDIIDAIYVSKNPGDKVK